jgi:hypothetical protein
MLNRAPTVEAAQKAVDDAAALAARWEADLGAAQAELEDLRKRAGAEVLDDERAVGRLAEAIAALSARVELAALALPEATARVDKARRVLLTARAASLRERAGRVRAAVETRQRRTDELLAALHNHEGCEYAPADVRGSGALGGGPAFAQISRTRALRNLAAVLEQSAAVTEQLVERGTAEQVAAAVGQPFAELSDMERELIGAGK